MEKNNNKAAVRKVRQKAITTKTMIQENDDKPAINAKARALRHGELRSRDTFKINVPAMYV